MTSWYTKFQDVPVGYTLKENPYRVIQKNIPEFETNR